MPARQRILTVDDHPLVQRGLRVLIESEPDLMVCAAAATHRQGLEAIISSQPNLVIIDLSLKNSDGMALVKEIHSAHKELPVLVLTIHDTPEHIRRAFAAGANGYVTKCELDETLLTAIRCVLGGGKFVSLKGGEGKDPE